MSLCRYASPHGQAWLSFLVILYLALFLTLDKISTPFTTISIISSWYLPCGLSLALLLAGGVSWAPLVFIGVLLSDWLVWEIHGPLLLLHPLLMTLGYSSASLLLRRLLGPYRLTWRLKETIWFIVITLLASGFAAMLAVFVFATYEMVPWPHYLRAWRDYWIGDATGIITLTPFLLVNGLPWLRAGTKRLTALNLGRRTWPGPAAWAAAGKIVLQAAAIALPLWLVFAWPFSQQIPAYYLLFPPLIGIALQRGLPGATAAIAGLNGAAMLASGFFRLAPAGMVELQFFMLVLALTGLVVGAVVTERRQTWQLLEASEEKFAKAFHASPNLMIISTLKEGRYLDVNESFCRITGYSREEVIGRRASDLGDYVHPGGRERLRQLLEEQGAFHNVELNYRLKSGKEIIATISAETIEVMGEKCVLAVVEDITERRRAEAEKDRLHAELLQVQKMESVGRLAGGIAHDFNNLLTVIISYSDLALAPLPPDSAARRDVQQIQKAAVKAAKLTSQLLAFARRQVVEPQVVNINHLILDLDNMLRRLIGEDIELALDLAADLGPVRADPGQLEQVLVNLAANARDAMPAGGTFFLETANVWLDQELVDDHFTVPPGDYVQLIACDTGTGMTDETMAHLFEPFFTTKEMGKGTGLGLATCQGIIRQSGGYIGVKSQPGRGTYFQIYLPRLNAPEVALVTPAPLRTVPAGSETVLLVEDDVLIREMVIRALSSLGYNVLAVATGQEALALAREDSRPINLVVTDIVMPHMNGRQLINQLRTFLPALKVLYISGYSESTIVHHGGLEEGIAFLPKPFTPGTLAYKVREILDS